MNVRVGDERQLERFYEVCLLLGCIGGLVHRVNEDIEQRIDNINVGSAAQPLDLRGRSFKRGRRHCQKHRNLVP
jgi:hypothetical protein